LDVPHVTARPTSVLPPASFTVAVSCTVVPTTTDGLGGATVTVATGGGVTVTLAVPFTPSLVAVIVAGPPAATPVTRPLLETVATELSELVHVTLRPVSIPPSASSGVALSCTVPPAAIEGVGGVTATDATGAEIVMLAWPVTPPLLAVIVTGPPALTPVTSPPLDTVATAVFADVHVTVAPVTGSPLASRGVAVSWAVCPARIVVLDGATSIDATVGPAPLPFPEQAVIRVARQRVVVRKGRDMADSATELNQGRPEEGGRSGQGGTREPPGLAVPDPRALPSTHLMTGER
jgi:hypothetical protein